MQIVSGGEQNAVVGRIEVDDAERNKGEALHLMY